MSDFAAYWSAYRYNEEAQDRDKIEWSPSTLRSGIVEKALVGMGGYLSPSHQKVGIRQVSPGVLETEGFINHNGLRIVIVAMNIAAPTQDQWYSLIGRCEDRARESLVACILPTSSREIYPLDRDHLEHGATSIIVFYPRDVDAIASKDIGFLELVGSKVFRRITQQRGDAESQFDSRTANGSQGRKDPFVPLDVYLQAQMEDHREWVEHPKLDTVTDTLRQNRGCLLVGSSSSGKSVLAVQAARSIGLSGWAVHCIDLSASVEGGEAYASHVLRSEGTPHLYLIDDLQSNPAQARLLLALVATQSRAAVNAKASALAVSWKDFAREAALWHESCHLIPVSSHQVIGRITAKYRGSLNAADVAALTSRLEGDVALLRLALEGSESAGRTLSLGEVAQAVWNERALNAGVGDEAAARIALVAGSLGRYDIMAPEPFLLQAAKATPDEIERLVASRLLKRRAGAIGLGHRSLAGLLVDWLESRGAWDHLGAEGGALSTTRIVLDYLRSRGSALTVETLQALHARAGFKERPRLNRRAAALVEIWGAFNAVVERIEVQQREDATWGGTPSSAMFAVQTFQRLGKRERAEPSGAFLRETWSLASGSLSLDTSSLSTNDDFEKIRERMVEEDAGGSRRPGRGHAKDVDVQRFHETWLAGLLLCSEAALASEDGAELAGAVEATQLASGAFYPERVPWCSARVLIGLAACDRNVHNSEAVSRSVEWLLRSRDEGGACANGLWESGTGTWNSTLETTAMVLLALSAVGYDCSDRRLNTARDYLFSARADWVLPGRELDGALALQAFLEIGGEWDDVAEQAQALSLWARGEALWNQATLSAKESLDQSCRVAQIASHLVEVGWAAIRADLPGFLEALALPPRFRDELRGSTAAPAKQSLNAELVDKSAQAVAAGTSEVSLDACAVVGEYRRFNERVRSQLRDWRLRIAQPLLNGTDSRENFLVWAAPGSGKSFFVQEIARELGSAVNYYELNLARQSKDDFLATLQVVATETRPSLVLLDEVDAREGESWPYEEAFSLLDLNTRPDRRAVFVLIGSSAAGLQGMAAAMQERPKGKDLLDRVPVDRRFEIPPMELGDRLVVFLSQVLAGAASRGASVEEVEKLAIYYILTSKEHSSPRQLRELAYGAVQRMSAGDNRLTYSDLFQRGDRRNQLFWTEHLEVAMALGEAYVRVQP